VPLALERLDFAAVDWEEVDRLPDRWVFQTPQWMSFVAATQAAEPVVARLTDGSDVAGYFTGLIVKRYGVGILGSPFPGWATGYMGFNLLEGVSRREAAAALPSFARALGCRHLELRDRELTHEDARGLGFQEEEFQTFQIDLRQDEDVLFGSMTSACRRCIRKAERDGVTVEEAHDPGFADDYYAQLEDVFAKQSLRPTYGIERVRALIEHVGPSGDLLLLRVRSPEGDCIATGIFPAHGRSMYFWGGASWRSGQHHRPNEALFWHAMRHWKGRGIESFDMGGGGEYKQKYGGSVVVVPHLVRSWLPGLSALRGAARFVLADRRVRKLVSRG